MKRRAFVKHTTLTAIGSSILAPLESLAEATKYESSDLSAAQAPPGNGFPVNFIAVGDWGRNGEYRQRDVAIQMGQWAMQYPNNFVISVGDNFYPQGVISTQDPLWHYSFESIYTAHSLQCDWYAILGNHDYGAAPDAQIDYSNISRRWHMPSRYFSKTLSLGENQGTALLVFIDTQPVVYNLQDQKPDQQLLWLNETLQKAGSDVRWKIVIGHNPCYTVGPRVNNYDTIAIRKALTGTLNRHKVDLYLAGHDHSLQHLKPDGFTHQFITGAGSELTPVTSGVPYSKFAVSENGFMYFSLAKEKLAVKAVSYTGSVLYETVLAK